MAAQLIHAAGESAAGSPLPSGTIAIALAVPDEIALVAVAERLALAALPHHLVFEPDPPWSGALMAIGVVPTADRRRVRRALAHLPLAFQGDPR